MLTDTTAPTSCSFTWDAENRLQTVSGCATLEFTYNALGQRVETKIGATNPVYRTVLYDGLGQVIAWHNRTTYTNLFLPLGGQTFATYEASQTFFLHSNHLGSTTFVTDQTGTVTQKSVFYPYGQLWQSTTTVKDERFASLNERDAETTLDPTLFRMYEARLYRWLSPDPIAGSISNPQSLNRFSYVLNNPTNFTDPLGLTECIVNGTRFPCPDPDVTSTTVTGYDVWQMGAARSETGLIGGGGVRPRGLRREYILDKTWGRDACLDRACVAGLKEEENDELSPEAKYILGTAGQIAAPVAHPAAAPVWYAGAGAVAVAGFALVLYGPTAYGGLLFFAASNPAVVACAGDFAQGLFNPPSASASWCGAAGTAISLGLSKP